MAQPARVRAAQLDLLRPAGPAPDRLAATIARLAALVGPDNVGAPRTENTWREEAAGLASFQLTGEETAVRSVAGHRTRARSHGVVAVAAAAAAVTTALNIRRMRPPEEIEVMLGPDGPAALRSKDTTARILVAAGPYRLSSEWWQTDADGHPGFSRDYWDVHATDGAIYRLHHDRHRDRWFLDGYYD